MRIHSKHKSESKEKESREGGAQQERKILHKEANKRQNSTEMTPDTEGTRPSARC